MSWSDGVINFVPNSAVVTDYYLFDGQQFSVSVKVKNNTTSTKDTTGYIYIKAYVRLGDSHVEIDLTPIDTAYKKYTIPKGEEATITAEFIAKIANPAMVVQPEVRIALQASSSIKGTTYSKQWYSEPVAIRRTVNHNPRIPNFEVFRCIDFVDPYTKERVIERDNSGTQLLVNAKVTADIDPEKKWVQIFGGINESATTLSEPLYDSRTHGTITIEDFIDGSWTDEKSALVLSGVTLPINCDGSFLLVYGDEFETTWKRIKIVSILSETGANLVAYDPYETDFTMNGLGCLTPTSCIVKETAGGMYELEMIHPIDEEGRWEIPQIGYIIKARAPVRESPRMSYAALEHEGTTTATFQIIRTKVAKIKLYSKVKKGKVVYTIKTKGTEVYNFGTGDVPEDEKDDWIRVCTMDGIVGYAKKTSFIIPAEGSEEYREWTDKVTISPAGVISAGKSTTTMTRYQLFRVYSFECDTNSIEATIKALHISYDLRGNIVNTTYEANSSRIRTSTIGGVEVEGAYDIVKNHMLYESDFTLYGDYIDGTVTGDYSYEKVSECLLDPDKGIVAGAGAMLIRDNFDIWMLPNNSRDTNVTIRRGKNLIGVTFTQDCTDIINRIIPVGQDKEGKPLYLNYEDGCTKNSKGELVPNKAKAKANLPLINPDIKETATNWQDRYFWDNTVSRDIFLLLEDESRRESYYGYEYPLEMASKVEYKSVKIGTNTAEGEYANNGTARTEMVRLAMQDFEQNQIDYPKTKIEVDFVILANTYGYGEYAPLQSLHLYDMVRVIDESIGLDEKLPVTAYEWNVLTEQYDSITLGSNDDDGTRTNGYSLGRGTVSGSALATNSVTMNNISNEAVDGIAQQASTYSVVVVGNNALSTSESETTLEAHLYLGKEDITETSNAQAFSWIRKSGDTVADEEWARDPAHVGVKTITVPIETNTFTTTYYCAVDESLLVQEAEEEMVE